MDFAGWVRARFPSARVRADGEVELRCWRCGKDRKCWVNTIAGKGLCFSCGMHFGAARMVSVVDGIPLYEALRLVAMPGGDADVMRMCDVGQITHASVPSDNDLRFPDESAPVLADNSALAQAALAFLHWRGLADEDIAFWQLRFCWRGQFAYRVLFPYFDLAGQLVFWGARAIDTLGVGGPKMLYPAAERRALLYNLDVARIYRRVILVEGPIDALHVGKDAVALGGAVPTREQVRELRRIGFDEVVLMLDADAAGVAGTIAAATMLTRHPWSVRVAVPPNGAKDPGECSRARLREAIDTATQISWADVPALEARRAFDAVSRR